MLPLLLLLLLLLMLLWCLLLIFRRDLRWRCAARGMAVEVQGR